MWNGQSCPLLTWLSSSARVESSPSATTSYLRRAWSRVATAADCVRCNREPVPRVFVANPSTLAVSEDLSVPYAGLARRNQNPPFLLFPSLPCWPQDGGDCWFRELR